MFYEHPWIFYAFSALAVVVFVLGLAGRIFLWRKGQAPAMEDPPGVGAMLKAVPGKVLFQTTILEHGMLRWVMHLAIFWGFILLFVESVWLMVLEWVVPAQSSVTVFFESYGGQALLNAWGDFWGVVLLAGVTVALFRRYVLHTEQLETLAEDSIALWFLLLVSLSGFAAEGVRVALGEGQALGWAFAGRLFTWVPGLLGIEDTMSGFWLHGIISLLFIAYIPYGKLLHLVAAPTEIVLDTALESKRGEAA